MKMTRGFCALAVAAFAVGSASATTVLQFDVNALTATAVPGGGGALPFNLNFTGAVILTNTGDANAALVDIFIDGTSQNYGGALAAVGGFTATINLVLGVVTGGNLSITDVGGDNYAAVITPGSGQVDDPSGQAGPFSITGLTFAGFFSGNAFANVNVTPWNTNEPLSGSFLEFTFGPDANTGIDENADIDVFVVIPLPTPFGMAGVGLLGLAALRRRR